MKSPIFNLSLTHFIDAIPFFFPGWFTGCFYVGMSEKRLFGIIDT